MQLVLPLTGKTITLDLEPSELLDGADADDAIAWKHSVTFPVKPTQSINASMISTRTGVTISEDGASSSSASSDADGSARVRDGDEDSSVLSRKFRKDSKTFDWLCRAAAVSVALLFLSLAVLIGALAASAMQKRSDTRVTFEVVSGRPADDLSASTADYMVHLGNWNDGRCDYASYAEKMTELSQIAIPTFVLLGDRESMDCLNPTEARKNWYDTFLLTDDPHIPTLSRQTPDRPENFAFILRSRVLVVGWNAEETDDAEHLRWQVLSALSWIDALCPYCTHMLVFLNASESVGHDLLIESLSMRAVETVVVRTGSPGVESSIVAVGEDDVMRMEVSIGDRGVGFHVENGAR